MKFTSIKQIPKEAIEMIDDVQWWLSNVGDVSSLPERLDSDTVITIVDRIAPDGTVNTIFYKYYYIEPRELEDKTFGINLYKKIHGER